MRWIGEGIQLVISIHALRKESDLIGLEPHGNILISIHALRKESDNNKPNMSISRSNFNPRSP